MSKDECKILSEQITARIDAETEDLKNTNTILKLELKQKDKNISEVRWEMTSSGGQVSLCFCF